MFFLKLQYPDGRVDNFEFPFPDLTIGRGVDNSLIINNPAVSSNHARIVKEGGAVYIEDLMSRNGTFLNGRKVEREKLFRGDIIEICDIRIEFSAEGVEERGERGALEPVSGEDEKMPAPVTSILKKEKVIEEGRRKGKVLVIGVAVFLGLIIITLLLLPEGGKREEPVKLDESFFVKLKGEIRSAGGLEIAVAGDEALDLAREAFDVAEATFKRKDSRKDNRYRALARYKKVIEILKPLEAKPPFYDIALKRKGELEGELFDILAGIMRRHYDSLKGGKDPEEPMKLLEDFLGYYPCSGCETVEEVNRKLRLLRGTH